MKLRLKGPDNEARETFLSNEPVWIGRDMDNDIIVTDRTVSRHQCRFVLDEHGAAWVEDADSRYGVCVNGSRVETKRQVLPGDLIEFGQWQGEVVDELMETTQSQPDVTDPVPAPADLSRAITRQTRIVPPVRKKASTNAAYIVVLGILAVAAAVVIALMVLDS